MFQIHRALLSVTDKTGLVQLARELESFKIHMISTGGTAKLLRENNLSITEVSEHTGFPEMLDGRVKTLHPKIHGGILGIRDRVDHVQSMGAYGIKPIDLVVVNLYAFEKTIARPGCTLEEAIENIDIGGPALIRAAAKNHHDVATIVDPADYPMIIDELRKHNGWISSEVSFRLAAKAFCLTHQYDGAICDFLMG